MNASNRLYAPSHGTSLCLFSLLRLSLLAVFRVVHVRQLKEQEMTLHDLQLEQSAAAKDYSEAFLARAREALRTTTQGMIVDDPEEDARLAKNLIAAAQRWKRALEALGCPPPPRLEKEAAGLL